MRAVLTTTHGDLSVLRCVTDYPQPQPGAGEALIKVHATAVNFHDIFTRRGMPGIRIKLPVVVGSDVAGEVVAVGEGGVRERIGQRVLVDPVLREGSRVGMIGETSDGGRAEYMVAPLSQLIELPPNVDSVTAAALPLAYGTAWRMLVTRGRVSKGEVILILGASGGVGVACVQIAKLLGATVVACASADDKLSRLRELGADEVINYRERSIVAEIARLYGKPRVNGEGGVHVAVNFTGGDTLVDTQKTVKLGGRILSCGATAGFDVRLDARYWWTFEHVMIGSDGWSRDDLETLLKLCAESKLTPVIDKVLPLERADEAERLLETRSVVGKIVLTP